MNVAVDDQRLVYKGKILQGVEHLLGKHTHRYTYKHSAVGLKFFINY